MPKRVHVSRIEAFSDKIIFRAFLVQSFVRSMYRLKHDAESNYVSRRYTYVHIVCWLYACFHFPKKYYFQCWNWKDNLPERNRYRFHNVLNLYPNHIFTNIILSKYFLHKSNFYKSAYIPREREREKYKLWHSYNTTINNGIYEKNYMENLSYFRWRINKFVAQIPIVRYRIILTRIFGESLNGWNLRGSRGE
jgi:hypothetical protein